jgi:hypothetical protein
MLGHGIHVCLLAISLHYQQSRLTHSSRRVVLVRILTCMLLNEVLD